jgi:hypothetical protein
MEILFSESDLTVSTQKIGNSLFCVVISVMMKRKKPLFRNVASGIARKWGFLHFTLILITTD